MHQTRKTHNAHNETQRRMEKTTHVSIEWYKRPVCISKTDGKDSFGGRPSGKSYFIEHKRSRKENKVYSNRAFRRNRAYKENNKASRRVLNAVCEIYW